MLPITTLYDKNNELQKLSEKKTPEYIVPPPKSEQNVDSVKHHQHPQ